MLLFDSLKQCQLEKTSCNETVRKLGQQLADKDAKRYVQQSCLSQITFVILGIVCIVSCTAFLQQFYTVSLVSLDLMNMRFIPELCESV